MGPKIWVPAGFPIVKGFEMWYLVDSFSVLMNWFLVFLSMLSETVMCHITDHEHRSTTLSLAEWKVNLELTAGSMQRKLLD